MTASLYIGVMSGTSADGIDACLASFRGGSPRLHGHVHRAYSADVRHAVLQAMQGTDLLRASELDERLADAYADTVDLLLTHTGRRPDEVRAIGCHGQTVLHRPAGPHPNSIQLGDPHRLAVRCGIDVVADFRRADLAAGGQGAPLAPAFHAAAFAGRDDVRAIVNIGGMANVSLVEPAGVRVIGFDTGPGNVLLDGWIARHEGHGYDDAGHWAGQGRVREDLLAHLLADPYFAQRPPKSTGREHFDLDWLDRNLAGLEDQPRHVDVQATLAELTARTIADGVALAAGAPPARVLVCGGGAYNTDLMARLRRQLPGTPVETTRAMGIAPEHVEPLAFAWLAQRRVRGLPGNRPEVTGASRRLVLGALVRAPRDAASPGPE